MRETHVSGTVVRVNGPIITAVGLPAISMFDIAEVGADRLIGEVIRLQGEQVIIQVYEDNTGLRPGDEVRSACRPLSVWLGPGLLTSIYDGIQRPLIGIAERCGRSIAKGVRVAALDGQRRWAFTPQVAAGAPVRAGDVLGWVQEGERVRHDLLVPPGVSGSLDWIAADGEYCVTDHVYTVAQEQGSYEGRLAHYWPVRIPRPYGRKQRPGKPLVTGLRIIDTFFPIASGGTAAIPGGFGTGKTMTQQSLAKWSDADIIVYIGCGERGNEMTEVLEDFPQLVDERSGRPLMERTVMIANTSNMPVPAREISIYTGVTIAEYYRDMGYSVAVMADSTSRWAEALRELSSRLGDMPAEEGFPPYLATRLAEFYERAGMVETQGGRTGSITIVGAVSPPGGDFSEPVTQHTTRFIRCFWALDKVLADARHYPSISWIDSYTEYLDDIADWWCRMEPDWPQLRSEAMNLLQEDNRLQQIVKLVGPDALPAGQRFVLFCAEVVKNAFLQQNSFDPNDKYCTPDKQVRMLRLLIQLLRTGRTLLLKGVDLRAVMALPEVAELVRLKSTVSNEEIDTLDTFATRLGQALEGLAAGVTE